MFALYTGVKMIEQILLAIMLACALWGILNWLNDAWESLPWDHVEEDDE